MTIEAPGSSHRPSPLALFEVSWEVCNKVGGIHTVVSTKAKTMVERFGDDYIAVGPWLLSQQTPTAASTTSPSTSAFAESCRALGRPGARGALAHPGPAAHDPGRVLRPARREGRLLRQAVGAPRGRLAARRLGLRRAGAVRPRRRDRDRALVARAGGARAASRRSRSSHEWMAGTALLHLKQHVPAIGTVFTTHATMLGRALAATAASCRSTGSRGERRSRPRATSASSPSTRSKAWPRATPTSSPR